MDEWITESALLEQIANLKPGLPFLKLPSFMLLSDWVRKELIPKPRGEAGGRGLKREWPAATAPEYLASTALYALRRQTVIEIRAVREICLKLESCRGPADVLAMARVLAHGKQMAGGRDLSALGPDVILWLTEKRKAMRKLYKLPMTERDQYYESKDFIRLMWGLCNGFFEGYRFEGNKLIRPEKRRLPEINALLRFPKAA